MAPQLEELPLFPLHTVLFPFANLRLHIFEDRYRDMVRMCLREDRPFGIVLIRSGAETDAAADPYMVGTAARIVEARTYDDGRMDIQVMGERRFRIRELDESTRPYLMGRVEPVVEHELDTSLRSQELIVSARAEFEVLIQRLFDREQFSVHVEFPTDPVVLSFTIANLLPMENLDKQRMLETTDTVERVEDLLPILRGQVLEAKPHPMYHKIRSEELQEWILPN